MPRIMPPADARSGRSDGSVIVIGGVGPRGRAGLHLAIAGCVLDDLYREAPPSASRCTGCGAFVRAAGFPG